MKYSKKRKRKKKEKKNSEQNMNVDKIKQNNKSVVANFQNFVLL